ncbi:hypothetical protein PSHT_03152, partial [Puccinia striiformis]
MACPAQTGGAPCSQSQAPRPKKEKEASTISQYKPAMNVVDPEVERIQVRCKANWYLHFTSNLIALAPKAGSTALRKAHTPQKELPPKKAKGFDNKKAPEYKVTGPKKASISPSNAPLSSEAATTTPLQMALLKKFQLGTNGS